MKGRNRHAPAGPAIDDRERTLERQNRVLVQLARLRALEQGDLARALREITEAAAETIEVERASVWLYDTARTRIRCEDLFERSRRAHSAGTELFAKDYPRYFKALDTERAIAAHAARTDPRTSEYTDGYLVPLGITAMLDTPIRLGGRMIGVVCHEHVGPPRRWSPDEQAFAGSVGDLVSLAMEVDERRRAENALRASEEQLRQAQKMEAVGRLAGGLAHDLNNLLTAILGYADLALGRVGKGAPLRGDLEEIKRSGLRAATLTQQLLAFGRKQVMHPRVIDLNAVVAGVEPMLRRLLGEDVELATRADRSLGRVLADPAQVEQVIVNLAVNARDAMPRGGRLTIETAGVAADEAFVRQHEGMAPGRYAMVAVVDTGTGMTKEVMSHLFEPFFTTKESGKGTGLGLSTVYGIVKQSGGHVTAYSEPGKGSTFRVYLPRVEAEVSTSDAPPARRRPSRGTETVLLVEDEVPVRELARRVLALAGYRVLEAKSASDALSICRARKGVIHLLLTDVVMPKMGGRQLWGRVTKLRPKARVLYVSGYAVEGMGEQGVLAPGTAFLQKPFSPEELVRKVREVLDRAPSVRGPGGR